MIANNAYKRLMADDELLHELDEALQHSDDTSSIICELLIEPLINLTYFSLSDLGTITKQLERMIHIGYRCGELELT